MKIENLKIESFRGLKDLEFNFKEGLNLFSGSNGIGKSTVIDAIMWVLCDETLVYGKQSADNRNQNNLRDIIKVSLKLDNDKYDDIKTRAKLEREDFGYSTNKYNEGTISKLDLIQVKENVLFTDKQVVNDKINCLVDYIGLYKAVGTQL